LKSINNLIVHINNCIFTSEMSPLAAIQNQLLISIIDFLLVKIPISHIRNTIITSKNLYFWYQ